MYTFSLEGYLVLIIALIICLGVVLLFRKHIVAQKGKGTSPVHRGLGLTVATIGSIVLLVSVIMHVKFQLDYANTPPLLKPFSEITAEPALLLTGVGFLIGVSALIIGLLYLKNARSG